MDQDIELTSPAPVVDINSDQTRWSSMQLPRRLGWLATMEWTVVGALSLLVIIGLSSFTP